ncbi:MAG: hypothetical protein WC890_01975 [Candidatus Margulisiibacteriota bacterium]
MVNSVQLSGPILALATGESSENANVDKLYSDLVAAGVLREGVSAVAVKRVLYHGIKASSQAGTLTCSVSYVYSELNRIGLLKEGTTEENIVTAFSVSGKIQPRQAAASAAGTELATASDRPAVEHTLNRIEQSAYSSAMGQLTTGLQSYDYPGLFNELLGHLYFSHGCIHMSPSDTSALALIAPEGLIRDVKPVTEGLDAATASALASTPQLSAVIFEKGLDAVATEWSQAQEVVLEIYTKADVSKIIVRVDGQMYAQINISGGPPMEYYVPIGSDSRGIPQYDTALAGRSNAGRFSLMYVTDHYRSQTYAFTTAIPQGAELLRTGSGWVWVGDDGTQQTISPFIANELELLSYAPPPGQRIVIRKAENGQIEYTYKSSISEEVTEENVGLGRIKIELGTVTYKTFPPAIAESIIQDFNFANYPAYTQISQNSGSTCWMLEEPQTNPAKVDRKSAAKLNSTLSTNFVYYDVEKNGDGNVVSAKWGSNDFSNWVFVFEKNGARSGEVIHSTPTIDSDLRMITDIASSIMVNGWQSTFKSTDTAGRKLRFNQSCNHFLSDFAQNPAATSKDINETYIAYYKLFHGVPYENLRDFEQWAIPLEQVAAHKLVTNYIATGRWDASILNVEEKAALDQANVDGTRGGGLVLSETATKRITGIYFSMYEKSNIIQKYSDQYVLLFSKKGELETQGRKLNEALTNFGISTANYAERREIVNALLTGRLQYQNLTQNEIALQIAEFYNIDDLTSIIRPDVTATDGASAAGSLINGTF